MNPEISEGVYRKVLLHASKFSLDDIYGFLIGAEGRITDVLPIGHTPLNACVFQLALEFASSKGLKLLGFYDYCESFPCEGPNTELAKNLASKLCPQAPSFYLSFSTNFPKIEQRQGATLGEVIKATESLEGGVKVRIFSVSSSTCQELSAVELKQSLFEEDFRKDLRKNLVDFEEHLDKPSLVVSADLA